MPSLVRGYGVAMCRLLMSLAGIRRRTFLLAALVGGILCARQNTAAQDTPLISGGVGFLTNTNGGNTTYIPVISPLLAAPLGKHLLVESRATLLESYFPKGEGQPGYDNSGFAGLQYLQLDYLATPHITVVAGEFLTPFGTYNERLTPIWISNFQGGPLIFPLGTMGTGSGVGGQVRGSAMSNAKVSIDYAAYFSAGSTNDQFHSQRSSGGKAEFYFPHPRLELGMSYGRLLDGTHQNFVGTHVWWEPADLPFKLRSEYAHGEHSQGYWAESAFRFSRSASKDTPLSRLEPVLRWQQTFRNSLDSSDGLPPSDTQRVDAGLDYHFPHEVRINTSYSRQFSSSGDRNVWQTGIVYRFLFPTWRGK
jgi:hypothetical protein